MKTASEMTYTVSSGALNSTPTPTLPVSHIVHRAVLVDRESVTRAVAALRHEEELQMPARYMTGENWHRRKRVTTHESTFNELVVVRQYLLKLQSDKITENTPSCHS